MVKISGTRYSTAKKRKVVLEKLGMDSFNAANYADSVTNDYLPSGYVFSKTDINCCGKNIHMMISSDRNKENQWDKIGYVVVNLSKQDLIILAKTKSSQLRNNFLSTRVIFEKSITTLRGLDMILSSANEYRNLISRASNYNIKIAKRGLDDILSELILREEREKELETIVENELGRGVEDAIDCMLNDMVSL